PLRAAAAGVLPRHAHQERAGHPGPDRVCGHAVRPGPRHDRRNDRDRALPAAAVAGRCGEAAVSEKTEDPTPQRIRKAREDGQVAHSKDFTQTVLVVALFGYTLGNAEALVRGFAEMMLMPAGVMGMDFDLAANALATGLMRKGVEMLAPFLG